MKRSKKKGQTVVEYLLVVVMIVGVASAVYVAIKRYLPGPLKAVKNNLEGDTDPAGRSAGSGQKGYREYYNNVEFKSK
ncbi:MAG: hypothetical protein R3A80_05755 [Bdellovibrionota bacterium]